MARARSTIVVPILLLLLLVSSLLGALGLWSARQFLDSSSWETMSSELIADPAIQTQVADQVTDAIIDGTDVEQTLAQALPPRLAPLAAPAAVALRDGTRRVVLRALRAPRVQQAWTIAVVATHQQAVNLIEGEGETVRLRDGGAIILDLRPLTGDVAAKLGLPPSVIDRIPEPATRVRLVQADALESAQTGLRWFKQLVVLFLVLVPLLSIAAVAASPRGSRRGAALAVAATVACSALLVLAVHRIAGQVVVAALADGGPATPAVTAVWDISTSLLTTVAGATLLIAAVLLLGALLGGPSRAAVAVRRRLEPALRHQALAVHGVVLAVAIAALALGLIPFIERPLGLVLLLLTLIAATELVRRAPALDGDEGLPPAAPGPQPAAGAGSGPAPGDEPLAAGGAASSEPASPAASSFE